MTLRDKIASLVFAHKHDGSDYTATAIVALPEIAQAQARIDELERQHTFDVIDAVNAQASIDELEAERRSAMMQAIASDGQAVDAYEAQLKAEAAIPCAYQMGLDAAAECASAERVAGDIRALTPPADIVEKALEKKHD